MSKHAEHLSQVPIEEQVRQAFMQTAQETQPYLEQFTEENHQRVFMQLTDQLASNQLIMFYGTKMYDNHKDGAQKNAWHRPLGIDTPTLSPHVRLILFPRMVFQPNEDLEGENQQDELDVEIKHDGPQAMVYFLDEFAKQPTDGATTVANLLFIPSLTQALIEERYPLEKGEQSLEFVEQIGETFKLIRTYVQGLPSEEQTKLPPTLAQLLTMTDEDIQKKARDFVEYRVEPLIIQGLVESPPQWHTTQSPYDAIEKREEYLHCSQRELPQRPETALDTPAFPWKEYTTNTYNRRHQLFGRYENSGTNNSLLRVDYHLDTTHFPGKYGFFSMLDITRVTPQGIEEHMILGQEVRNPFDPSSIYPVIIGGDIELNNEEIISLSQDKGTKNEISRFLQDAIHLQLQNTLTRGDAL